MKKYSAIFTTFLLLGVVTGCGGKKDTTPKEFKPHEIEYGGDSETISKEEFRTSYLSDYQKYTKYKNAYVTLKSDKPLYDTNDRDEYFKDFDELRFVGILNDEDRSMSMGKLFDLLPINIELTILSTPASRSQYHVGRAISLIQSAVSGDTFFETFYQYRATGNNIEITFSKDYYPVNITSFYDGATFTMDFRYYNVEDLPKQTGEVDQETFLIHAYARANRELTVNEVAVDLTLKNAIIGETSIYSPDLDAFTILYENGSGTASCCYKLDNLGLDKTGLPVLYDYNKKISEYKESTYSSNFTEEQQAFIHDRHFRLMFTGNKFLFASLEPINAAGSGLMWGNKVDSVFTVSPLKVDQKIYNYIEETGTYTFSKMFRYEFNDDGLLSYFGRNDSAGVLADNLGYTFTYSTI